MAIHILVIDEEQKWINFVKNYLGKIFDVQVATSSESALVALKKNRYDLIIASSHRSDLLQDVREKFPDERFVVVTGQPTTEEAIHMYRLGALDYFPKDFRTEIVTQKVFEAVQKPAKMPA